MRKTTLILLTLIALVMVSCRPHGILTSRQMRHLLVDLHKTEALLAMNHLQHDHDSIEDLYFALVLSQHGITQAEFDSSLVWYTNHPKIFDKIYPKVLADLAAEREAFELAHAAELGPKQPKERKKKQPRLTREQAAQRLDSMLWMTQHGYPSPWNPLVHDTEDQLLPQVSILR